nr:immunoglobulin light chain junction region [Macaca mulatta]MOY10603.1 immunoglobulin light chain junction region [Macaca mulatta]MOY13808.1 immunoglobulin light chain junction region [Macaca mulatta]MOY14478.1 immunoglobulin light chain junction region [Macaca mulatta]
CQQGHSILPTF